MRLETNFYESAVNVKLTSDVTDRGPSCTDAGKLQRSPPWDSNSGPGIFWCYLSSLQPCPTLMLYFP